MKNLTKNRILIIIFFLLGFALIVVGYKANQGGTVGMGILISIFSLVCTRLTIQRK